MSVASSLTEDRLSEAVSVFTHGGETLATSYGANAVAFFGEGAIVLVDPFVSPVSAAALDAVLRARTAAPVTHVVLTHHHTDHALGAGYFAAKGAVRRALDSGTEEDAREAVTRAFPRFRLGIVLPSLVARLR